MFFVKKYKFLNSKLVKDFLSYFKKFYLILEKYFVELNRNIWTFLSALLNFQKFSEKVFDQWEYFISCALNTAGATETKILEYWKKIAREHFYSFN